MRKLFSIFILCVLLSIGIHPGFGATAIHAQDAQGDPVVEVQPDTPALPLVDIDGAGADVIGVINGIVTGGINAAWFAPLVALLVGLLKRFPGIYKDTGDPADTTGVSAPTLSFSVSAVLWIAAAIVTRTGYTTQFNSLMDLVVQSAPYMIGFLATLGLAPAVHEYAASVKAPVLGYKRTPVALGVVTAIPASDLAEVQTETVGAGQIEQLVADAVRKALDATGFNWTSPTDSAAG